MYNEQFLAEMSSLFPNFHLYRLKELVKNTPAYRLETKDIDFYNSMKYKNWIYFTPNWDFALSDWVRQIDTAKNVYCFFIDKDSDDKFWEELPQEPSIIIKTSRWHHAYWLLDKPFEFHPNKEKFTNIMWALVELTWWDNNCKDIARIMRLPGTKYWKDNKWETVITVIKYNPEIRYTLEEFENIYKKVSAERVTHKNVRKSFQFNREDLESYDKINDVNVSYVLMDLAPQYEVHWPNISDWWEMTHWYKYNRQSNYLNDFAWKWRPQWWPFAVAKHILGDAKSAFEYFKDRHWITIKKVEKVELEITLKKNPDTSKEESSQLEEIIAEEMPTKNIDEIWFIEIKSPIWTIEFNKDKRVTTLYTDDSTVDIIDWFIYPQWYYINPDWVSVYVVEYVTKSWRHWVFYLKELWKNNELEKILSTVWLTWFWSKKVKSYIISFIQWITDELIMIEHLWIYSKDMIVTKWWMYSMCDAKWKKYFINIPDVKIQNNYEEIIHIWNRDSFADVEEMLTRFRNMYKDEIWVTAFCTYILWLFLYPLKEMWYKVPFLNLVWLTQSGKTELRYRLMELIGINKRWQTQASATEFTIMKALIHYLPINVWEFDNESVKFDWNTTLKNMYDRTPNQRWTASQKVIDYPANWVMTIDWESRILNNAVYSRGVTIFMNPSYRKKIQKIENINWYFIKNFNNIYLLWNVYPDIREEVVEFAKHIDTWDKERFIDNYSLILSVAKIFWYYDLVKDDVLWYFKEQIGMMWESNLEKTIKQVLIMCVINKLPSEIIFKNQQYVIRIEVQYDISKRTTRVDDLMSNIQLVNHHFRFVESESEVLYVPIEYIVRQKLLHLAFNRYLDYQLKSYNVWNWDLARMLKIYSNENWYNKQRFYQHIEENFKFSNEIWYKYIDEEYPL